MKLSCARVAVCLLVLAHLAVALVPCTPADAPRDVREVVHAGAASPQLAAPGAEPCHHGAAASEEPSLFLDARCPCGCQDAAAPSSGSARIGAALLLAAVAPPSAPGFDAVQVSPARAPQRALPPLDHVPLSA